MKLTKKQRKFLKTIENPKDRKYQKQQFKLQNKFDSSTLVFIGGVCSTKREEFERINGKGKTWRKATAKEVDEKFNKAVEKMYEEMSGSENSLTKESLRDLTEPKAESLINKEAPKGYNLEEKSLSDFIKDCEKWLLHDLDFGTCSGIKNRCVSFKQFELASKFRDKEIQILSKFDEEKLNSFLQQGFIDLNTMIQVKKLSKTDNQNIPKEFCVEITEENKEVLYKYFGLQDFNTEYGKKTFLISGKKLTTAIESVILERKTPIVSTEEFLRYIGKEEYYKISTPIGNIVTEPKKEVLDKPLEFDLPKKEDAVYLSIDEIMNNVNFPKNHLNKDILKSYLELIFFVKKVNKK